VQPEDYQIGQLAAEVIKLCKEAEVARLKALALDKELQLSMLLDKLHLDPLVDPDLPRWWKSLRRAPTSPTTSTKAPNTASSLVTPPGGPPGGQPPFGPQGQPAGPPGGQPLQGPPGGPPGGPPQAAAPQQVVQAPHGTNGAMKGQPPTIFDGERSKTNQFMTEFQLWWMINNGAEVMNNPFQ